MTHSHNPNPGVYVHLMDGYGYYITLAFIITTLVFDILLLVRIKYGDAAVTHLTTWPYTISLILLNVMLIDTALTIVIFQQQPELIIQIMKFEHLDSVLKRLSAYFMRSMGIAEYFCMIIFVLTRAFEHKLLNFFIIYQQHFRLESLNVAKDKYQRLELKF